MMSYIVTGRSPAARSRLANLAQGDIVCVSTITEGEVRYGLSKSQRAQLQISTDWFLSRLKILSWRSEEAHVYGQVRARQEKVGKTLHSIDMLDRAHTLADGATLV